MMKRLLVLLCALSFTTAFAQTAAGPFTVKRIRTGWDAEAFAVESGSTILNPAGCSTPDGYISDVSQAGYKTHYAAVLLAYANGKNVVIAVHNTICGYAGRPKIVGVNLEP